MTRDELQVSFPFLGCILLAIGRSDRGSAWVVRVRVKPSDRGIELHLSASEELLHLSAEVVLHLGAQVGAADGERSGRGTKISAGSGEDAKWMCPVMLGHGPLTYF